MTHGRPDGFVLVVFGGSNLGEEHWRGALDALNAWLRDRMVFQGTADTLVREVHHGERRGIGPCARAWATSLGVPDVGSPPPEPGDIDAPAARLHKMKTWRIIRAARNQARALGLPCVCLVAWNLMSDRTAHSIAAAAYAGLPVIIHTVPLKSVRRAA